MDQMIREQRNRIETCLIPDQEQKKRLRRETLAKRDILSLQERQLLDGAVRSRIQDQAWFLNNRMLIAFVSFGSEVDTIGILESALSLGQAVYVPKVLGQEMEFFRITGLHELKRSRFGIPEPDEKAAPLLTGEKLAESAAYARMLVPGVAFDLQGNRIGYGKGFYDKYLHRQSAAFGRDALPPLYGICYGLQLLPHVPADERDFRLDGVIEEHAIHFVKKP